MSKSTIFSFNGNTYSSRLHDGCSTCNPISPVLANIFKSKLETDAVRLCFFKKEKDIPDELFEHLNNFFAVKECLITTFPICVCAHMSDDGFEFRVHKKPRKFPTHWRSEIITEWKRNCIMGDLHRTKRNSKNVLHEVQNIKKKYRKAGYQDCFVTSTTENFIKKVSKRGWREKPLKSQIFFLISRRILSLNCLSGKRLCATNL